MCGEVCGVILEGMSTGGADTPWYPDRPIWALLPESAALHCREDYEERAAILEFHGGQPKATAEANAYAMVLERYGPDAAITPVPSADRAFRTREARPAAENRSESSDRDRETASRRQGDT